MEPREKAALYPKRQESTCSRTPAAKCSMSAKPPRCASRVRSYFLQSSWINAKTGSLVREIADLETIVVANPREALALENTSSSSTCRNSTSCFATTRLILTSSSPRRKNIRAFISRAKSKKMARFISARIFRPAWRGAFSFVHKRFMVPSCTVDLTRDHPRPCLQYYIKRCQGPCVAGLTD